MELAVGVRYRLKKLTCVSAKARRLRHLPVEKGLLREVKMVQKMLDSLVKCKVWPMSFARRLV